MTVRMLADRLKYPLEGVEVVVKENTKADHHLPDGLEMLLKFKGPLTSIQKERLRRAANTCPVKRMLKGEMINGILLKQTE
eukprot:CAMPEP_0114250688 /NCGR_PEP_ID=MMETSP0058-20121206/14841_1 /TAXON_ID=36894 /ORGANISM="Pyramimonas parkeae, CCMP726" /LENGTH=80 /DNA_ID=CAMNT_0001364381 /DNA_START=478 /DNA_END=720 /DNA_ORIENTATION=+